MSADKIKNKIQFGIQEKFVFFFLSLDFLIVSILMLTVNHVTRLALEDQIRGRLAASSRDILGDLDEELVRKFNSVEKLSANSRLLSLLKAKSKSSEPIVLDEIFDMGLASKDAKIALLDKEGRTLVRTKVYPPLNTFDSSWKAQVLSGIFHTETVSQKEGFLYFATPVQVGDEIAGVLDVSFNLDFVRQLTDKFGFKVALLTSTSRLLAGKLPIDLITDIALMDLRPGSPILLDRAGDFYAVFMTEKVPGLDWTVVLSISKDAVFEPLTRLKRTWLWVGLATALLLVVVVILRMRALVKPIINLRDTMRVVMKSGSLQQNVDIRLNDEIGELAATFNEMIAELHIQRRKSENSAKMAALGEMSARIAHEVNTPLTVIGMNVNQMEKLLAENSLKKEIFSKLLLRIKNTSSRISGVVNGTLNFARNGANEPFKNISLKSLIADSLELCRERFKITGVKLSMNEIPMELKIQCRQAEIHQVLLNLLSNAFDAVSSLSEKWVKIEVIQEMERVRIEVIDSGLGIPKDIQEHLFKPFFTKKEVGCGTGLGLNISQKIIDSHHGSLYFDNMRHNTTFVIDLPEGQQSNIEQAG